MANPKPTQILPSIMDVTRLQQVAQAYYQKGLAQALRTPIQLVSINSSPSVHQPN